MNFDKFLKLDNQIYGWNKAQITDPDYQLGDTGLLDLIGDADSQTDIVSNVILNTVCTVKEIIHCADLDKVKLSFLGIVDCTDDVVIYYEIWVNIDDSVNMEKKTPPPSMFASARGGKVQSTTDSIPKRETINLLSSRSLKYFYGLRDKHFSLGKVNFYNRAECPYL